MTDTETAEQVESLRFGWCCDFDFDNGTYRTTPECISRTRNADAVEAAMRPVVAAAVAWHRLKAYEEEDWERVSANLHDAVTAYLKGVDR